MKSIAAPGSSVWPGLAILSLFLFLSVPLCLSVCVEEKSHERIRPWKNWKSGNSLDEIAKSKWPSLKKFRRRPLSWTLRFYRAVWRMAVVTASR